MSSLQNDTVAQHGALQQPRAAAMQCASSASRNWWWWWWWHSNYAFSLAKYTYAVPCLCLRLRAHPTCHHHGCIIQLPTRSEQLLFKCGQTARAGLSAAAARMPLCANNHQLGLMIQTNL